MANMIIRPAAGTGNKVIVQDQAGGAVLSTADSGATFNAGVLSAGVTGGSGLTVGLQSMQVFETAGSATWTRPANIKTIKVYCTGAGGGGGGPGNAWDSGGGGGGGGTAIRIYDVSSTASAAVVVGAGGASAGTDGSTSGQYDTGGNGGTSSFAGPGQTISATGGNGGQDGNQGYVVGGASGAGVGGQLNLRGQEGDFGFDGTTGWNWNGDGGSSFWSGGAGIRVNDTAGQGVRRDASHGAGGGGGTVYNGGAIYKRSGAGGAGIVVIEEYA